MRVLVSAASRHGATGEIAERIGEVLRRCLAERHTQADVVVRAPEDVPVLEGYDAFVLGSAVYMGHWLDPARTLVRNNPTAFAGRPVWLFSSGPIGAPPKPDELPVDVGDAVSVTHAREHRLFTGKIDRDALGFSEKAIVVALRAPSGDFRDWDAIESWATGIAEALRS